MTIKKIPSVVSDWFREEKKFFEEEYYDIARRNTERFSPLSWIAVLTIILCSVMIYLLVDDWHVTVYHVGAVVFFAVFGLITSVIEKSSFRITDHMEVLCVLFDIGMLVSAIAICTFPYPDLTQVFVSLVFVIIPVIFIIRTKTSIALILCGEAAFLLLSWQCKNASVFRLDVFSSLAGCVLGIAVSFCVLSLRVSDYRSRTINKEASIMDPLCNVLNRYAFDIYSRVFVSNASENAAVVLFDIDNFSSINNEIGTEKGDELLVLLSSVISEKKHSNTCAGRIEADKFCLVTGFSYSPEELGSLVRKIQNEFKTRSREITGRKCYCSAGISMLMPEDSRKDYNTLFHEADEMLSLSKSVGGKCYNIYGEQAGAGA